MENDDFSQNPEARAILARMLERSEVLHAVALDHLEQGRLGVIIGDTQAHLQSAIALKMSEEGRKLDAALLRLIKENPQLRVKASSHYSRVLDGHMKTISEIENAKVDRGGKAEAAELDSLLATLAAFNGRDDRPR
jgi:hypothetical protein